MTWLRRLGMFASAMVGVILCLSVPAIATTTTPLSDGNNVVRADCAYDVVPVRVTSGNALAESETVPCPPSSFGMEAGLVAAESSTLDWSIVSKVGETREAHVLAQHGAMDLQKPMQGVFYGEPQTVINDAWSIAQSQSIKPITSGGVDIYVVPRPNSGFAGGYSGQLQNLDKVTIITQKGTTKVITGYPGNGMPLPRP